ncbi:MAG: EamA family transporter [Acidobacteriota bacterium]
MTIETPTGRPAAYSSTLTLIAAFAAVYIIWGSTYLAIRLVMDTMPDFTMIGLRFCLAGALMLAWSAWSGQKAPSRRQIARAAGIGVMLLFGGTGAVVWATVELDTGLVALLIAMEPLWLAILMLFWPGADSRPSAVTWLSLGLGFAGAALLAAPGEVLGTGAIHLPSALVLMLGCLSWAAGSLISRNTDLPSSQPVNAGVQMVAGGLLLTAAGLLGGEAAEFRLEAFSWTSIAAFLYLVVFGSIIAFSAYAWLIRTVSPTLVATHTYVNPVVAIFLGWLVIDESIGPRTLAAAALILGSVVIMTTHEARVSRRRRAGERAAAADLEAAAAEAAESAIAQPSSEPRRCA